MRVIKILAITFSGFMSVGMGDVQGPWTYIIENGGATVVSSSAGGAVTIPSVLGANPVFKIGRNFSPIFNDISRNNTSVTSLVIPGTVTNISTNALRNCVNLTNVTIGNGVIRIEDSAFGNCTNLNSVSIPNSVTSIGTWAFQDCKNLTNAIIGNSVENIGVGAFSGCSKLTTINFSDSVRSLGDVAFSANAALTNITIGGSLTNIGTNAFQSLFSLKSIYVSPNNLTFSTDSGVLFNKPKTKLLLYPAAKEGSYTIPNSVTSIEDSAFRNSLNLIAVIIPGSVTNIGPSGFEGCRGLTEVSIPDSVSTIGSRAFWYCRGLTSISIPDKVQIIEDDTFQGCTALARISVGNGVTNIRSGVFKDCTNLASATIGSNVTSVGSYAFANCGALTQIEFLGNAPNYDVTSFLNSFPTVYYVNGKTGWGIYYAGLSTASLGSKTLTTSFNLLQGSLVLNPRKSFYQDNESVVISAIPKPGYLFISWAGASVTNTNPITLSMSSNQSLTANFIEDIGDSDGDGLTNYQENVVYGTNPNQKDSNTDGVDDGKAVLLGYDPLFNFAALTSHWQSNPPTGLYTSNQILDLRFGGMVIGKTNNQLVLNYQIVQSTDLTNWTSYRAESLVITNAPADRIFLRLTPKQ